MADSTKASLDKATWNFVKKILEKDYSVKQTLGSGGFGKVKRGAHLITKHNVAIKIMDKEKLGVDLPRVQLEINALKNLHHPNICKLYQVVDTFGHICLVLEYCEGGELFDYIVERGRVPERDARRLFREMVCAVGHIHSRGFAHRDLKPENMLLDGLNRIRLIDFGLCASWQPSANGSGGIGGGPGAQNLLRTCCGSPCYAAPELLGGRAYTGTAADVWSLGVILFAVLCGYLPFEGDSVRAITAKIGKGLGELPDHLSPDSRDLIRKMLTVDPNKRVTMKEVANHTWVTEGGRFSAATTKEMYHGSRDVDLESMRMADPLIINEMSKCLHKPSMELSETIEKWAYDSLTGIYLTMLDRKKKGLTYKLIKEEERPRAVIRKALFEEDEGCGGGGGTQPLPPKKARRSKSLEDGLDDVDLMVINSPPQVRKETADERSPFRVPDAAAATPRRAAEAPVDDGFVYQRTPLKTPTVASHPSAGSTAASPAATASTPWSSKKRFREALGKSIGKVRRALLTPVRTATATEPRFVKHTQNVAKVPYEVDYQDLLEKLEKKLQDLNYKTDIKGFVIRGVKDADRENVRPGDKKTPKSTLELEVARSLEWNCLVIKRKRLNGSSIDYAKVCEKVLEVCGRQVTTV